MSMFLNSRLLSHIGLHDAKTFQNESSAGGWWEMIFWWFSSCTVAYTLCILKVFHTSINTIYLISLQNRYYTDFTDRLMESWRDWVFRVMYGRCRTGFCNKLYLCSNLVYIHCKQENSIQYIKFFLPAK